MSKQMKTPMMQQYQKIKADYTDAFLFFRLGDFYELFFEDAVKAAKELEITLTARGKGEDRIPMCGVPYHSCEGYISRLIEKGYKVAICEQTEDPAQAKGVVRREVVQLITPGTVMDGAAINEKENNYLLALSEFSGDRYGLAAADLTTGEIKVTSFQDGLTAVMHEAASYSPKEIVAASSFPGEKRRHLNSLLNVTFSEEDETSLPAEMRELVDGLQDESLTVTVIRLLNYLYRTKKRSLDHLQPAVYYFAGDYMKMDVHSKRNLELTETIREKKKYGSLLWLLDETVTAMGGRLLKQWIDRPLLDPDKIRERHSAVGSLMDRFFEREELKEQLRDVYDLERLSGKVAFGTVNARDLIQLRRSLERVPAIFETALQLDDPYASRLVEGVDRCGPLRELLEESLRDDPPVSVTEGDMIKDGFNDQLDTYRDAIRNGRKWITQLEKNEREETGIRSLKVGFNKVFGYYIEVTRSNLASLPEGRYERKQTLANAERFITPELKEKEALILEAEEKIGKLEYEIFLDLRKQVAAYISRLQDLAKVLSTLDCLQSLAEVSEANHYVKPEMNNEGAVDIADGRHPVVEKMIDEGDYVPNDIRLGKDREMLLITGPNMAGKSTYMRQLALCAVMAQCGAYVPAGHAVLPVFDQIFTRIGAADDLAQGQSTFMVEMMETRHAVTRATARSLILLDEIGRGTSTYDGMALAQAIMEYIHRNIGAKTLFSTHYHELTRLEEELPKLKNVHVSAAEENGEVVFLHKVIEGAADKSYGIYVARLAQLPEELISRAGVILEQLEKGNEEKPEEVKVPVTAGAPEETGKSGDERSPDGEGQLSLFDPGQFSGQEVRGGKDRLLKGEKEAIRELSELDPLHMTPFEAIQTLHELQKKLRR
ncbi:DNA mismatch repair protein MutS [Alteribacter natronophilus]|uniref:DNA mismatch repair protein MutS n=1 Tax=Alteribacter natronophilus TaxID=2583810 RepID=UPI00110F38FD|nr:DNA mismatch repair protein MutS [Alteribacter natronophilus]TMW74066.1 DNA mismatch repair protein MutS [Alteribacter natronophilus]